MPNNYGKWTFKDGKLIIEGKGKDGLKDGITKDDNYKIYETKKVGSKLSAHASRRKL